MTHKFFYLMMIFLSLAGLEKACGSSVNLAWDASASADVSGYNVYYGTSSGNYPYKINAGNATSLTVSNLLPGGTYFFVATSYDTSGEESSSSPEICFIIPGLVKLLSAPNTGGPTVIQFPVVPGHWYEVQATTDLQNWTSIWQSDVMYANVWMQYADPDAGSYGSRYYRVVSH